MGETRAPSPWALHLLDLFLILSYLWHASSLVVVRGLSCPMAMWDLSSLTRDRTCTTSIGRPILNY